MSELRYGIIGAGIIHPCALNSPQFLAETACVEGLQVKGDRLAVPTAPGLGLELLPDVASRLKVVARH